MVKINAYAKVNLYLAVEGGPREDGFHPITTLMRRVSLCDELTLELRDAPEGAPPVSVKCSGLEGLKEEDNLAYKAALLFLDSLPEERAEGFRGKQIVISIEKRIPAGAGLGGGSADAAAVLDVLNRLSGAPCSAAALSRLGARIGSDAPFFLGGSCALCTGRGEIVTPVAPPALPEHIVLALPHARVSTAAAYAELDKAGVRRGNPAAFVEALKKGEPLLPLLRNDFERVILPLCPSIARIKESLLARGAAALMSGSGSCVYGLFEELGEAEACARALLGSGDAEFCRVCGWEN